MIDNPFLPSPTGAAAWSEGFIKGLVSQSAPSPGSDIAAEDDDAFNQGVAAGAAAQTAGLAPPQACIPAVPDDNTGYEQAKTVVEGIDTARDVIVGAFEAGLLGALKGLILPVALFIVTTPGTTETPSTQLSAIGQPVIDRLAASGVGSLQLYCGIGIDNAAVGSEFMFSPLFLQQDQARAATDAMKRHAWVIVSWRTDQCGSFAIADSAG